MKLNPGNPADAVCMHLAEIVPYAKIPVFVVTVPGETVPGIEFRYLLGTVPGETVPIKMRIIH
ncbi:MAG: hypothetical protein IJI41_09820 [Anaerolineaceae bacterium]|nr:hypothetical protein [Anaerolineaceae bacterium]